VPRIVFAVVSAVRVCRVPSWRCYVALVLPAHVLCKVNDGCIVLFYRHFVWLDYHLELCLEIAQAERLDVLVYHTCEVNHVLRVQLLTVEVDC
jgi:hypothetical protein